ncbi:MAG: transcriptional repressor [Candidatus Omnitrophica bacterium]|nr:transcriptional repressor [Candidatus Omnitrophota bacterium]HXK92178.1 Fur family transcriptional regulator [bacterium]
MKTRPQSEIEGRIGQFTALCRERGLKVTHQRLMIFHSLLDTIDHPTAEEVFSRIHLKLPTLSLDTVYRTLSLFEDYGLISRVQCLSDKGRYDANMDHHHHFICLKCKSIEDFYWPEFDQLELPPITHTFGKINLKKVELRGICQECEKNNHSQ